MRFTYSSVIRTTPEQLFAFHDLPDAFLRLLPPGEINTPWLIVRRGQLGEWRKLILRRLPARIHEVDDE